MEEQLSVIKKIVKDLLEVMDFNGEIEVAQNGGELFILNIKTDEAPYLIGQGGQNLAALQQIVRALAGKQLTESPRFIIDINDYQKNRLDLLKSMAKNLADEVLKTKEPRRLSPMNSYERRLVHMALADLGGVVTDSEGEGEVRHVVIRPRE